MLKKPDATCPEQNFSEPVAMEDFQGDWQGYLQRCARYQGNEQTINSSLTSAIAYKRQCALAYLGKRAQFHGGASCNKHPRIFTPQLHSELEHLNKAKRFGRYPWLETLLNLLAEIEQSQEQTGPSNVFSLVSQRYS